MTRGVYPLAQAALLVLSLAFAYDFGLGRNRLVFLAFLGR